MDTELITLRLHNAQLAAALRAIVDRDLSYLDGFVQAGLIHMRTIKQAREVLRAVGVMASHLAQPCPCGAGTNADCAANTCAKVQAAAGVGEVPRG